MRIKAHHSTTDTDTDNIATFTCLLCFTTPLTPPLLVISFFPILYPFCNYIYTSPFITPSLTFPLPPFLLSLPTYLGTFHLTRR